MTVVVDASMVTAALTMVGPDATWAEGVLERGGLAAPHFMPVEVANILRRSVAFGEISADAGSLAHAELQALRVELFPYAPFAARVWELRSNFTAWDAWYVAVAEGLDADLATLDLRLARAPGAKCGFLVPG